MTGEAYFDELYAVDADPWNLASSPYEQRKLAIALASLTRQRYQRGFEPGCAIGVSTAALARRCDALISYDAAAAAVDQARERVPDEHVTIQLGRIPQDWPEGTFDLIVLSELLYYLDTADRRAVAQHVDASLRLGGDVLTVHWRTPFAEAAANGDAVDAELSDRLRAAGLVVVVEHVEERFRLQVFHRPE